MTDGWDYTIHKHLLTFYENGMFSNELNIISFFGLPPKYDIRKWANKDEGKVPMGGISLTEAEAIEIINAISKDMNRIQED